MFRPWNTFLKAIFPCQGLRRLIHNTELKPAAGLDAFRIEEFIGKWRSKVRIGKGRTLVHCGSPASAGRGALGSD